MGRTFVFVSGVKVPIGGGSPGNDVLSVFGRTGTVVAAASDFDASQVDNDSDVGGTFVDDALNNLVQHYMQVRHDTTKSSASTTFVPAAVGALQRETTGNPFTHDAIGDSITTDVAGEYLMEFHGQFTIAVGGVTSDIRLERKPSGGAFAEYEATQLLTFSALVGTTPIVTAVFSITAVAGDSWRIAFNRTAGTGTIFLFADDMHQTVMGPYGE